MRKPVYMAVTSILHATSTRRSKPRKHSKYHLVWIETEEDA